MNASWIGWGLGAVVGAVLIGVGVSPTLTAAETASSIPAASLAPAQGAKDADSSNCVTCHTSESTMQELVKEPEALEQLSEGEG